MIMINTFISNFLKLELSSGFLCFSDFAVDSIGRGKLSVGNMLHEPASRISVHLQTEAGNAFNYVSDETGEALWTVSCSDKEIILTSRFTGESAEDFILEFNQKACHATLLGRITDSGMEAPCVLHLPGQGSFAVSCDHPGIRIGYAARRTCDNPFVRVSFPAATATVPLITYRMKVVAIHPDLEAAGDDPIYDGFRRGFLNIFQINPNTRTLANNASSDPVPLVLHSYAEYARNCPPLLDNISAVDYLVRPTVERYLDGFLGYGQAGYGCSPSSPANPELVPWPSPWTTLDTLPSLLISAAICAEGDEDCRWARDRWGVMIEMAREMIAADRDGNGLVEYPRSGNYGEQVSEESRPSNWWDCINFGHEDAYSNALAYRACRLLAPLAVRLGRHDDAETLNSFADRLKQAYVPAFLNPETGILAGWRSADGQLHDYWFTFIQSVAVSYGLIEGALAGDLMDRIFTKMEDVGFNRFDLGLPGNLVPIKKGDYQSDETPPERFGVPRLEDGSDGFQFYENGGATGCWVYYTIQALRKTGRNAGAAKLIRAMLNSYSNDSFLGFGDNGMSKDWRDWNGGCHGYEGLLAENFMALLCVADHGVDLMEDARGNDFKDQNRSSRTTGEALRSHGASNETNLIHL